MLKGKVKTEKRSGKGGKLVLEGFVGKGVREMRVRKEKERCKKAQP